MPVSNVLIPPQIRRVARKRGVTKTRVADEFHTFVEIKPAPGRWRVAAHITTCVTITVLGISAIFGPRMGLLSLTGTFMCTVSMARPWRHRVTILGAMTLTYLLCVILGVSVAGNSILTTLTLTGISGITVLIYNALVGDPPGPVFLTIGPAIGTYLPTTGLPGHTFVTAVGLGAACSVILSLALQWPNRHGSEDKAVADAGSAVENYLTTDPDGDYAETGRLRDSAYGSIFNAAWLLRSGVGKHENDHWRDLARQLRHMHIAVVERTAAIRLPGAKVAVPAMQQAQYLGRPTRRYLLEWGLSRSSLPALAARRAAASVFLTCLVSYGLGVAHPYWAVMTTALLVSMHGDRLMLTHRAAHRFVGTCVGVGLFFLISLTHPRGWWVIVVALICVFLLQWTVVRNYAIGAMFITPMALLVASAGTTHKPLTELMGDRIFETAMACTVCVIVLWAIGRRLPILLVRRQFRRALRALERVLIVLADGEETTAHGVEARRNLVFEQLEAAHVLQIAQAELPLTLGRWDDVEASLNTASYVTLAACWVREPLRHLDAQAMANRLARLINSLPPVSTEIVDANAITAGLADVVAHGTKVRSDEANTPMTTDVAP